MFSPSPPAGLKRQITTGVNPQVGGLYDRRSLPLFNIFLCTIDLSDHKLGLGTKAKRCRGRRRASIETLRLSLRVSYSAGAANTSWNLSILSYQSYFCLSHTAAVQTRLPHQSGGNLPE